MDKWNFVNQDDNQSEHIKRESVTYWQDAWRRLKKNKLAMIGLYSIATLFLLAICCPIFTQHNYSDQNLSFSNIPPRFNVYKTGDGDYLYVHNEYHLIKVARDGTLLKKINPIEESMVLKYKIYKLNGKEIKLDFSKTKNISKEKFKLIYDNTELKVQKQVGNKLYPLGSDSLGRDLLTRILYGARISLTVGVVAALVCFIVGVLYGGFSGYEGGSIDNLMMRIVDVVNTIPLILYVIILMVVLDRTGLSVTIIAIGSVYWVDMARLVRGQILSLKEQEFILAARTIGVKKKNIIIKHLIPNTIGPIIVSMTMMIPGAIFTESFLSFIGLGVSAPQASWGTLANDALTGIRSYPYQLFFPSLAIAFTMLAFNFLGDGLRDALDPRLRK